MAALATDKPIARDGYHWPELIAPHTEWAPHHSDRAIHRTPPHSAEGFGPAILPFEDYSSVKIRRTTRSAGKPPDDLQHVWSRAGPPLRVQGWARESRQDETYPSKSGKGTDSSVPKSLRFDSGPAGRVPHPNVAERVRSPPLFGLATLGWEF